MANTTPAKCRKHIWVRLFGLIGAYFFVYCQFFNTGVRSRIVVSDLSSTTTTVSVLIPPLPDKTAVQNARERSKLKIPSSATEASGNNSSHPLDSCKATAQVELVIDSPSSWVLYSSDLGGNRKTMGGDEFYVTYVSSSSSMALPPGAADPTAVARVTDLGDGSYSLNFVESPRLRQAQQQASPSGQEGGTLVVNIEYTCGIGKLAPPAKETWTGSGATATSYSVVVDQTPQIVPFQGAPSNKLVSLEDQKFTFFVGDSVMEQFAGYRRRWHVPNRTYFKKNLGNPLNLATEGIFRQRIRQWHGHALDSGVAVILGSSTWDLLAADDSQGDTFQSHLQAIENLVASVRKDFPNVRLLWKSPTPFHIHRLSNGCYSQTKCGTRIRYMSQSRSRKLYELQKQFVTEKLQLPFLDIYDSYWALASHTLDGDGRHFDVASNQYALQQFYPNTTFPFSSERDVANL